MVQTDDLSTVRAYLNNNPIVNLNILGILENEPSAEIFVDRKVAPRGVAVRAGAFTYCFTEQDEVVDDICESLLSRGGRQGLGGIWRPLAEKIQQRFTVCWDEPCSLYYLPPDRLQPGLAGERTESVRLEDAPVIDRYYVYQDEHSLAAVREDILYRPSAAVYIDGNIVSWVLVHNDNSMGILFTREEFRGRGYGLAATATLARKLAEAGKIPFLQIHINNRMSPGIARKCGFIQHGWVNWFCIEAPGF